MAPDRCDVVLDDTDNRAGHKFRDANLMGYPVTVTVGRKLAESGTLEITDRRSGETRSVADADIAAEITRVLGPALDALQ
jgi:prolyl-tRNA synthetase